MSSSLQFYNRQTTCLLRLPALRKLTRVLLKVVLRLDHYQLGIYLVDSPEIAAVNEQHLSHAGPTDVITFDYNDQVHPKRLHGEIFVCVPIARDQARQYRSTWQAEVVRYIVHGLLHLQGFDDLDPRNRRTLKREENRLIQELTQRFRLEDIGTAID